MLECHQSKLGNTALKPPCLASRNKLTSKNTTEQSRVHRLHGGRASVRLYSRDDVWGALACQRLVVQKVAEGFRPLTAQGRGTQIPVIEPSVEIDPITIPIEVVPEGFDSTPIPHSTATKTRIETSRGPRHSSKLQTLLPNSREIEEPTDSSLTSSESSTLEKKTPTKQQTTGNVLYVPNVLSGVVHVAITAPAWADFSRSLEHEGKRLQTACRCHLTLPPTCYMIQRQPPLSLIL